MLKGRFDYVFVKKMLCKKRFNISCDLLTISF